MHAFMFAAHDSVSLMLAVVLFVVVWWGWAHSKHFVPHNRRSVASNVHFQFIYAFERSTSTYNLVAILLRQPCACNERPDSAGLVLKGTGTTVSTQNMSHSREKQTKQSNS